MLSFRFKSTLAVTSLRLGLEAITVCPGPELDKGGFDYSPAYFYNFFAHTVIKLCFFFIFASFLGLCVFFANPTALLEISNGETAKPNLVYICVGFSSGKMYKYRLSLLLSPPTTKPYLAV